MIRTTVLSLAVTVVSSASTITFAFEPTAPADAYNANPLETPVLSAVQLQNLNDSPYLDGAYVIIEDSKYCPGCSHSLADRNGTNAFQYQPGDPELAEVNAYYHIDRYRDYVANSLGFSFTGTHLDGPTRVDAHAMNGGSDLVGAFYSPRLFGAGSIATGDLNRIDSDGDWIPDTEVVKEMALSADVLVHEFSHAITDNLISIGAYNNLPDFLKEGWADYLMASFLDEAKVGNWTDDASFRAYRRSLTQGISQQDFWPVTNLRSADGVSDADYLDARLYYNSMVWSDVLWRLRDHFVRATGSVTTGAVLADRLVMRGIQLFVDSSGASDDPLNETADAVSALKTALVDLQGRNTGDPLYDAFYQAFADTDIDTATVARFPLEAGPQTAIANDERQKGWARQTGREDIALAIIDTDIADGSTFPIYGSEDVNFDGVLDAGEDIDGDGILDAGNLYINPGEIPSDGLDNEGNGYIDDIHGWDFLESDGNPSAPIRIFGFPHGDQVANAAGAEANNANASVGVAWDTSLVLLRVTDSAGGDSWAEINQRSSLAIDYAIANDIPVVNFSRGLFGESGLTQSDALNDPYESFHAPSFRLLHSAMRPTQDGIAPIVVAAAGNAGWDIDTAPVYPAGYALPNMISVTSTNGDNTIGDDNFGKYSVDLAGQASDTSFAAPQVSGALALLLSEQRDRQGAHPGYRTLTSGEMRYLLLTSTDSLPTLAGKTVSGGRLNVDRLLAYYEDDADWDGYSAKIESLFGSNPMDANDRPDLQADADGDGLSNELELAYGTVPVTVIGGSDYSGILYPIYLNSDGTILSGLLPSDSDQDGISDFAEVQPDNGYFTDPANPDSDGDGVNDGADTVPTPAQASLANASLAGSTQTSDDFYGLWTGVNAVDGDPTSWWQTAFNTPAPHWLVVDLGDETTLYRSRLLQDSSYAVAQDYTIELSRSAAFNPADTVTIQIDGNAQLDRTDEFPYPVQARYARLTIETPVNGSFFRIKEFELLGTDPRNLALGSVATASDDFYGFWTADLAVDGDPGSHWQSAANTPGPHWLQLDLGTSSSINRVVATFPTYTVPTDYRWQFSSTGDFDNTALQAPYEVIVSGNSERTITHSLKTPVQARYIRLLIEVPAGGTQFFRIPELEVHGTQP